MPVQETWAKNVYLFGEIIGEVIMGDTSNATWFLLLFCNDKNDIYLCYEADFPLKCSRLNSLDMHAAIYRGCRMRSVFSSDSLSLQ